MAASPGHRRGNSIIVSIDRGESVSLTMSQTETMALHSPGFTEPATTVMVQYAGGWTIELDGLTYSAGL